MALDLKNPTMVQAKTAGHNRDSFPKWSIIDFEFPANDKRPAVKVTWYDGGQLPPGDLFEKEKVPPTGVLLIGDAGKLLARGDYCEWGGKIIAGGKDVSVDFPKTTPHFMELCNALRGGPPATSNFPDYAGPLTETILLGNLAVWAAPDPETLGRKIDWDAKTLQAANAPECEGLIRPTYRPGYVL